MQQWFTSHPTKTALPQLRLATSLKAGTALNASLKQSTKRSGNDIFSEPLELYAATTTIPPAVLPEQQIALLLLD